MIAMVRRVRQPGCQQDYMLVLISPEQGLFKSTGLRALIGNDDWFADRLPPISQKDALLQLHGKILIERPEVENLSNADKAFLTSPIDRFRAPFARVAEDHRRTCSFAGSTNFSDFLHDASGGRRYWPCFITRGDRDWIVANCALLWRLACEAEAAGEVAWLDTPELQNDVKALQRSCQRDDPWTDYVLLEARRQASRWTGPRHQHPGVAINGDFVRTVLTTDPERPPALDRMSSQYMRRCTDILTLAGWTRGFGRLFKRWFPPNVQSEPDDEPDPLP